MSLSATSNNLQNNLKISNRNGMNVYAFEDFRLDTEHLMLYRDGSVVPLTPKVVETLVALVEKSGEVISKEVLIRRVWGETAVEESNLSQNLYILRKMLGNRSDGKSLIETFRRRGYRFNGEIRYEGTATPFAATSARIGLGKEATHDPATQFVISEAELTTASRKRLYSSIVSATVAIGLAILFSAGFFAFRSNGEKGPGSSSGIKLTRLTPDQDILAPAISPDGKYLVYDLTESGKHSLWLKDLTSGSSTQTMPVDDAEYFDLQFSPDGKQVYYGKTLNNHPNLTAFRIPVLGGEPQLVAYNVIGPISVSPDGGQIAFMRNVEDENQLLAAAAADSSKERILSRRSKNRKYETWGSKLSWSPDGSRIAICGSKVVDDKWRHELIEIYVDEGTERVIPTPDWN
ncbi:MAG: winged helix-turn-helix domain-containing protein [Acidobacteriota bacterium]